MRKLRLCFFSITIASAMQLGGAITLPAQKGAAVQSAPIAPPRGLFAAQTEPRTITLSWYAAPLPSNYAGEQYVVCNVGGREVRPRSSVSHPRERPGFAAEPLLQPM